MADDAFEARFLDEVAMLSLDELAAASGLAEVELQQLIDEGLIAPARAQSFSTRAVVVAHEARRIRREFALDDAHSVCVVVQLVERVHALERDLAALRARLGLD